MQDKHLFINVFCLQRESEYTDILSTVETKTKKIPSDTTVEIYRTNYFFILE